MEYYSYPQTIHGTISSLPYCSWLSLLFIIPRLLMFTGEPSVKQGSLLKFKLSLPSRSEGPVYANCDSFDLVMAGVDHPYRPLNSHDSIVYHTISDYFSRSHDDSTFSHYNLPMVLTRAVPWPSNFWPLTDCTETWKRNKMGDLSTAGTTAILKWPMVRVPAVYSA